ncbi:protein NO VEIN isoform X2 [Magnolia sinica]|uniref:protein NO VEIN isoform X2 n=1 Tax=Magnolia sinica TaxID=86752 RepID=UPI0026597647|nr:protein NO VEIN isoform X2 [Magnolia sinica]
MYQVVIGSTESLRRSIGLFFRGHRIASRDAHDGQIGCTAHIMVAKHHECVSTIVFYYVNALIHCFVGVRRITSLYDLEVAICKNEGIDQFEELGMGLLLRHPLVEHYFLVPSDATEIFKITSEEIISCLADFMDTSVDKEIQAERFLDFLAKKHSVVVRERLGVRIQSLGLHITCIREARKAENATLQNYIQASKLAADKQTKKNEQELLPRRGILSQKHVLDRRFSAISARVRSFSSGCENLSGKHIRFVSSSSEDESDDDVDSEDGNSNGNDSNGQHWNSSQNRKSSGQRVNSCPYPSAAEEMVRLGLTAEMDDHASPARGDLKCNEGKNPSGKKRKCEKQSGKLRSLHKYQKMDMVGMDHLRSKDEFLPGSCKIKKKHEDSKEEHGLQSLHLLAREHEVHGKPGKKLHGPNISASIEDDSQSQGAAHDDQEKLGDLILTSDTMEKFITTWKETCREYPVVEVFCRMVNFYQATTRQRKKMKEIFSSYPGIGLLNVAVTSMKHGMWDSLYDTFQAIGEHGFVSPGSTQCTEMIDIGPSSKRDTVPKNEENITKPGYIVTVDDIMEKIALHFELDHLMPRPGKLPLEKQFVSFRKFHDCEMSLMKQFSVKKFGDLGHGDFLEFMDKHVCLFPYELRNGLTGALEVSMLEHQLLLLLSQAAGDLQENVVVTKQHISALLRKQFPLISLQIKGSECEDYSDFIKNQKSHDTLSCVLFSITLLGTCSIGDSLVHKEKHSLEIAGLMTASSGSLGIVSGKDALECLLRAPMLSDLHSWSHWDLIFAPSLGPLLEWLLNEVHTKELSCVVTRDGKIIRIDHSATVDEFLEASLQGSAFQTAVKLLSLLSLYGGTHHIPLSLLKCYAHQAIEVIIKNYMSCIGLKSNGESFMHGGQIMLDMDSNSNPLPVNPLGVVADIRENDDLIENLCQMNKAVAVASKFILDCLGYLPSEFRSFAADVLLAGLRDFTKDAPAVVLCECNQTDQRIMLHDIGFSLGILEWIEDYHAFSSATDTKLFASAEALCKTSETVSPALSIDLEHAQISSEKFLTTDVRKDTVEEEANLLDRHHETFTEIHESKTPNQVLTEKSCSGDGYSLLLSKDDQEKDAALIIESIRREEFGLDPNLKVAENNLLKKQHARLGRALHCLSQELYSQDSHFLLELVQNADDNVYPENVEPTLVFILQATGIIVINNEKGFSAQNIRALCDVGNSTKKGSGAGYIGHKGIGFKSVFRVTDAPEIHSNGFHVKFDASEGQIGFVLPTVVSPCDINLFTRQISSEADQTDTTSWNTCIVLPFRSKLKEGTGMSSIMSMFSDLHPSLLLFLHRLQCIKFRNIFNNSLIVMRRETAGDGIVKVSHGKEKMSWLVASQRLQAIPIRPDVQTTEIAIAFTLQESNNGEYRPHLEQQPVFAFLPLRTYGLKFILQGDFVLPSSREEVDGDSAWNQWLLSEFPALFISAEKSFCALSCFQESPGKAVTAYMRFVPLVGEVHGFFSHLPHTIISKLRMSNCLLLEGQNKDWVPPCRVLRGWDEQARVLLPESLLHQHLGLGYLNRDIVLSDPLAKALGIQDYGPKILTDIMSSICCINDGIKKLGLDWLSSWLSALYATLSVHSSGHHTLNPGIERDLINCLRKIPFIPLSDGSYGSLAEGPIWLPCDAVSVGSEGEHSPKDYPNLYAKLRTVNPVLLSVNNANTYSMEDTRVDTLIRMLHRIGVQRLSAHEVIKNHILPAMSDDTLTDNDRHLMAEYLSFVMLHLQSTCPSCHIERVEIVLEIQRKAVVLTNNGYKRPFKDSIHFSKEFGNPIDVRRLICGKDDEWHEVDSIYLKHPSVQSLSFGLMKWREFFQELGVTDFVQIIHVEKKGTDVSHAVFCNMMWDGDLNSGDLTIEDWESPELVRLMSTLSTKEYRENCKYLLEVLDKMWDDHFSKIVTSYCAFKSTEDRKTFESSFMNSIRNLRWIASSMDEELHHPKDLFYDCEAVRSILGAFAPYAVPQVRSNFFLKDIGFKTQVTIDDALAILQYWKTCTAPVRASIAQMSKFYTFIWDGMATSKGKVAEVFRSGPSIFVPFINRSRHDDVVSGIFLSPGEMYWHDPTGCVDRTKELVRQCSTTNESCHPSSKTLADVYPNLYEFFVNECGIRKIPSLDRYLQILLQLSSIALPSQAANAVFRVLLKWADDLKSGFVDSHEIASLKECLVKLESTVLPTEQDRWVSLHPSFGLVCWCDDEELRKQFKHSKNIDFLCFGELRSEENKMLSGKLAVLMQALGVPALSEVVSREAIFYGMEDCRVKASLVDWVLPYAQRYLYKLHPDIYLHLKQLEFENLSQLQVVVVEKLFYKHAIKGCDTASGKRFECSCLLQGNTLYLTRAADSHSIFLELSRLFFKGSPELHLANFLHMITTMAESGSTEEQMEFFIVTNQKVPKLPIEEPLWSLSCLLPPREDETSHPICASPLTSEPNPSKIKLKPGINSNWPPTDWKTAPDFRFARANHFRTKPGTILSDNPHVGSREPKGITRSEDWPVPVEINGDWIVPDELATTMALVLQDPRSTRNEPLLAGHLGSSDKQITSTMEQSSGPPDSGTLPDGDMGSSTFTARDQLCWSKPNENQAFITGRLGELVAYKYFVEKLGLTSVRWVNEETETGLPYDMVIGEEEESKEYIEVKATRSLNKDWFMISTREWQMASERGDSFSIAHVVLADPKNAKITVFKNPVRLCQQAVLNLVVLMPRQQKELPVAT